MTDGEGLIAFLREAAGDRLRTVLQYQGEDLDLDRKRQYVRDDIAAADDIDFETIVRQFQLGEPIEERREGLLSLGAHHVTLRLYDDAVVLHFPQGESVGTIVSLDVDFLPDVARFVDRAVAYINQETPQRIEALPKWDPR